MVMETVVKYAVFQFQPNQSNLTLVIKSTINFWLQQKLECCLYYNPLYHDYITPNLTVYCKFP